jgi:hypothetical protein
VRDLKKENAQLRGILSEGRAGVSASAEDPSLAQRVTELEGMFAGLQDILVLVVNMLSAVLR